MIFNCKQEELTANSNWANSVISYEFRLSLHVVLQNVSMMHELLPAWQQAVCSTTVSSEYLSVGMETDRLERIL